MIVQPDLSKPVYDHLKRMIQNGELQPGQKLVQEDLAKQLGVSRTPLLKALQSLEHEMLVESKPRRGMYVKELSINEMLDVYECRVGIECTAVQLATERSTQKEIQKLAAIFTIFENQQPINRTKYSKADEEFHDLLIDLAKNPVLKRMSSLASIHKRAYMYGLLRQPEETLPEHLEIIQHMLSKDVEKAVETMKRHISLSKEKLKSKAKINK